MNPIITHKVSCDNSECSNYEYLCDAFSVNDELVTMYCGVCGNNITHTAVLIEGNN